MISRGTLDSSPASPRDIFREAILRNAASIIITHNHPSGSASPSQADMDTTRTVADAGRLIGIPLLDHIITGNGFYSFKENGFGF